MMTVPLDTRASLSADVIGAFRTASLILAVLSGIASVLACSLPGLRLS